MAGGIAAFRRRRRAFSSLTITSLLLLAAGGSSSRADFSFVHVTDTHVTASEAAGSAAQKDGVLLQEIAALSPRPAFVINTGDVVEEGTPAEFAVYCKTLAANLSGSTPVLPVYAAPGNHDVRWNPQGKEGYVKGTGQPRYQSWTHENVHFILLDSNRGFAALGPLRPADVGLAQGGPCPNRHAHARRDRVPSLDRPGHGSGGQRARPA
jgi:hypothetical protein